MPLVYVQYVNGRNIGDEYRYVLERRTRPGLAGSLLERPGLILNPWELRETHAERERLRGDEAYRASRQMLAPPPPPAAGGEREQLRASRSPGTRGALLGGTGGQPAASDIGFDFLPVGSQWRFNLKPDDAGVVRIPLAKDSPHTALDIVLADRFGTVQTRLTLPDRDFKARDIRLVAPLDPDGAFSRQKTVTALKANQTATFPDLSATRYQAIQSVEQAFDLLYALNGHTGPNEFAFLKNWPALDPAEKRRRYGEYACNELHIFLHERDRAFFDEVVRPYLKNKKDKTFVDRWLLGQLHPADTRLDRLQQRNAMERALLARRGGPTAALRAALREEWELLPPDPDGFARQIRAALQSSDLDETVAAGRDKARREARAHIARYGGGAVYFDPRARSERDALDESQSDIPPQEGEKAAAPALRRPAAMSLMEMEKPRAEDGEAEESREQLLDLEEAQIHELLQEQSRCLYRVLPKTKEWAERNYYRIRVADDKPERIGVNRFWLDVAAGQAVSAHLLEAHRNTTEIVTALAFCGLPFTAPAPQETREGARLSLTVTQPALLVAEQILPAKPSADERPLLLSQQFFRPDDLYRFEGNERIEKFVTGEFVRRTVYGARVTLTNPTASRRRLHALLQIPQGALPVRNGFYTDDREIALDPYSTRTIEYFFVFPESGPFPQFPVHVAANEAIVGRAEPRVLNVADAPTETDRNSWAWISQHADSETTLAWLARNNLRRLNLDEMAWRLKDRAFFERAADLLTARGLFHGTVFSYAILHRDVARARIWLARSPLADQVGPFLESELLTVRPVDRKIYEHLEYDPLVNPRAHPVGARLKILNTALDKQYRRFLATIMFMPAPHDSDRLALTYYLLLQDRVAEAAERLATVRVEQVEEKLQLDYLKAWLALRNLQTERALALARPHAEHPVPRWRARFESVLQAVAEAGGAAAEPVGEDAPARQADLDRLAAQMPSLEIKAESGRLTVAAHNLRQATLNLYPMDIELLFSRRPFLTDQGADFAVVRPAFSRTVELRGDGDPETLELPADYRERNVMVEIVARGQRSAVAWYANRLRVRKMESYGQVEVRSARDNAPLPGTYVKVFARGANGRESFWKDGYTDLRGRFDYVSRNDRTPEEAAEFALLILHPELGAEIRKAAPPAR